MRKTLNVYFAVILIALNVTGPIVAIPCSTSFTKKVFTRSTRTALSKAILTSALLLLLPAPTAHAGPITSLVKPSPQSVIEIGPQANDWLRNDCLLPLIPLSEASAERCQKAEVKIVRYLDHFPPQENTSVRADAAAPNSFRSVAAPVLGGERDVQVVMLSAKGVVESEVLKPKPDSTDIEHRQTGGNGTTLVVWDGPDGKPEIQTSGLGRDNFRNWNADRFIIKVTATDRPGSLIVTVYDGANKNAISRATIRYDEKAPQEFSLLFDSLRPVGKDGRADLTQVGALSLKIIPDVIEGKAASSTTLDFIALAGPQCNPCAPGTDPFGPIGGLGGTWPYSSGYYNFPGGYWASGPFLSPEPILPIFFPGGGYPGGGNPGGGYPGGGNPGGGHPGGGNPGGGHPGSVPEPNTLTLTLISAFSIAGYRGVRYVFRPR